MTCTSSEDSDKPRHPSAQSDQSLLCAHRSPRTPRLLHAASQNGRMPRLIWVFVDAHVILMVLSCCGSLICLEPDYFINRSQCWNHNFSNTNCEHTCISLSFLPTFALCFSSSSLSPSSVCWAWAFTLSKSFIVFSRREDKSPSSLKQKCEPQHYKTIKMICAPSEDSDQPWRPPRLISLRSALNG